MAMGKMGACGMGAASAVSLKHDGTDGTAITDGSGATGHKVL